MAKPSRKLKESETIFLDNGDNYTLEIIEKREDGQMLVSFHQPIADILEKCGQMPIPPYLQRDVEEMDKDRYQTVFANYMKGQLLHQQPVFT